MIDRRAILEAGLGPRERSSWLRGGLSRAAQPPAPTAPGQPFDFAWLKGQAHWLASNAYQPSKDALPPAMAKLGYDQYQSIRFRSDRALWADAGLLFACSSSTPGAASPSRCICTKSSTARLTRFSTIPSMFEWDKSGVDPAIDEGSCGFRRLSGAVRDGLARRCRGIPRRQLFPRRGRRYAAVWPVGAGARRSIPDFPRPEEFPRFTSFWFERPAKDSGTLTLYALLDSPSIAGALRMQITPGRHPDHEHRHGAVSAQAHRAHGNRTAHQHVLLWQKRSRAAQTTGGRRSMIPTEFRCGPARENGSGGPLINPAQLHVNSYFDDNPRGFGLLQRDRNFDHYQDDGVYYDRRPSLWVEPKPDRTAAGARARCNSWKSHRR